MSPLLSLSFTNGWKKATCRFLSSPTPLTKSYSIILVCSIEVVMLEFLWIDIHPKMWLKMLSPGPSFLLHNIRRCKLVFLKKSGLNFTGHCLPTLHPREWKYICAKPIPCYTTAAWRQGASNLRHVCTLNWLPHRHWHYLQSTHFLKWLRSPKCSVVIWFRHRPL